ncbi:MAG: ATP-binding cassette domain-containing protein [bacterium]|jgi:energy-coupling factor transport system ATP-binding protein
MSEPVIQVDHLYYKYDTRDTYAVEDVNLTIEKGEFVAIIGQNGSGKTTMVKHFNGLHKPTKGRVIVEGKDTKDLLTSDLARSVGYVFQNPDHQIFAETVLDEVSFGPKNLGFSEEHIKEVVNKVLEEMALSGKEEDMPFQLSRGQRQRLAVASVLAMEPSILIIDEPTTGQDWRESIALMELVNELNRKGHTCIVTTHNMNLVSLYARRVIVMRQAKIALDGPTQDVFREVDELRKAAIKPPDVYALTEAIYPGIKLDKPILPDDLAELIIRNQKAGR